MYFCCLLFDAFYRRGFIIVCTEKEFYRFWLLSANYYLAGGITPCERTFSCLGLSPWCVHTTEDSVQLVIIVEFVCPFSRRTVLWALFFFSFTCMCSFLFWRFVYLLMPCDCLASMPALDVTYLARASETWMRVCIFHSFCASLRVVMDVCLHSSIVFLSE